MITSEFNYETTEIIISDSLFLFMILTIVSIAMTLLMSIIMIPVLLRIENNKEKVFFTYSELSKMDIDDRKRHIEVFFHKLRQSTHNPGGSLFYQRSSKIVSSRLITSKMSFRDENKDAGNFNQASMVRSLR